VVSHVPASAILLPSAEVRYRGLPKTTPAAITVAVVYPLCPDAGQPGDATDYYVVTDDGEKVDHCVAVDAALEAFWSRHGGDWTPRASVVEAVR
jgi:hypothetical protein